MVINYGDLWLKVTDGLTLMGVLLLLAIWLTVEAILIVLRNHFQRGGKLKLVLAP